MRRLSFILLFLLGSLRSTSAQVLPLTVNVGIAPDTSATAPMGYTVALDAQPAVDIGLPAVNPSCKDFVGSAINACVPFSVSITTAGTHSVTLVGYNLGGNSPPKTLSFNVSAAPGSGNLRLVK